MKILNIKVYAFYKQCSPVNIRDQEGSLCSPAFSPHGFSYPVFLEKIFPKTVIVTARQ